MGAMKKPSEGFRFQVGAFLWKKPKFQFDKSFQVGTCPKEDFQKWIDVPIKTGVER